jgi:hypothetical protein
VRPRDFAVEIGQDPVGCHDGNCVWGASGGMQTNGGCQCIKGDRDELRRELQRMGRVLRSACARLK